MAPKSGIACSSHADLAFGMRMEGQLTSPGSARKSYRLISRFSFAPDGLEIPQFHTRRETDPSRLTHAAGYTREIIGRPLDRLLLSLDSVDFSRVSGRFLAPGISRWDCLDTSRLRSDVETSVRTSDAWLILFGL